MSHERVGYIDQTVRVYSELGAATTGKFLTDVARALANRLTTLVMQNPGMYDITIVAEIKETKA